MPHLDHVSLYAMPCLTLCLVPYLPSTTGVGIMPEGLRALFKEYVQVGFSD